MGGLTARELALLAAAAFLAGAIVGVLTELAGELASHRRATREQLRAAGAQLAQRDDELHEAGVECDHLEDELRAVRAELETARESVRIARADRDAADRALADATRAHPEG